MRKVRKVMELLEYLKNKYGLNEPIYVEEIQFKDYSGERIAKELDNAAARGEIKLFDPGIYYFPIRMFFGDAALSPDKVIERRFLGYADNVYGYVSGMSLENAVGLSTQVPNLTEITTNNETADENMITIGGHWLIKTRRSPTTITKENVNTLQFLDLMANIIPSRMDETEKSLLKGFAKDRKVRLNEIKKYAGFFPQNTMINMRESKIEYELT